MPKAADYRLAWSSSQNAYKLYERDGAASYIAHESPEWFAWLARIPSFAFSGRAGHYTARKEASSHLPIWLLLLMHEMAR